MRRSEPWRRPSGLVLGNLKFGDVVPHIIIQSSRLRPGEFQTHAAKGLLQHYRQQSGHRRSKRPTVTYERRFEPYFEALAILCSRWPVS
jgi:hypothetical protein